MKNTKQQKGITLVALIITIVVLLILAVVAITEIGETGIIAHAENSAGKYNNSVRNEVGILAGYEDFLNNATSCKHYYGDDIYCDYCPTKCPHTWDSNGTACTTCPFTCQHDEGYSNGICAKENCGYNCPHDNAYPEIGYTYYDENYCIPPIFCPDCYSWWDGDKEAHDWSDGYCYKCYTYCQHGTWSDGMCSICGMPCEHQNATYTYEGNDKNSLVNAGEHAVLLTCQDCGISNAFVGVRGCEISSGDCTLCGCTCSHDAEKTAGAWYDKEGKCAQDIYCSACGTIYATDEQDHYFYGGYCNNCGIECPHSTITTVGPYPCGDYCHEEYYTCATCGMTTGGMNPEHNYINSYCSACGHTCGHDGGSAFEGGICQICGYVCTTHDWSNHDGVCKNCRTECTHSSGFGSGNCGTCGMSCPHENITWQDDGGAGVYICLDCGSYVW